MAHVRAARALVPGWLETAGGRFVVTASAAGLLTMIGSAPYSVTKHASVGLRRVALGHLRPPRHRRAGDLPAGRADPDARGRRPAAGAALARRRARPPSRSPTPGSRRWTTTGSWSCPTRRSPATTPPAPRTPTAGWPACASCRPPRRLPGAGMTDGAAPRPRPGRLPELVRRPAPGEIAGDLSAELIAGGKSNLTYTVTDGTRWWIVRRPPLGPRPGHRPRHGPRVHRDDARWPAPTYPSRRPTRTARTPR